MDCCMIVHAGVKILEIQKYFDHRIQMCQLRNRNLDIEGLILYERPGLRTRFAWFYSSFFILNE